MSKISTFFGAPRMQSGNITRVLGAAFVAAALMGCSDDPKGLSGPLPSTFLTVDPPCVSIDQGETIQLTATRAGEPATVTWESSDPAVATVSATGFVTSVTGGFAAITATGGGEMRSASLNVVTLTGTALTDGVGVPVASSGARGSQLLYRIFVPEGTTNLTVTIAGGTGDVDLYMLRGTPPTYATATCESFNGGNDELCTYVNPPKGTYYIMLDLWDPYAGATLMANVTP